MSFRGDGGSNLETLDLSTKSADDAAARFPLAGFTLGRNDMGWISGAEPAKFVIPAKAGIQNHILRTRRPGFRHSARRAVRNDAEVFRRAADTKAKPYRYRVSESCDSIEVT